MEGEPVDLVLEFVRRIDRRLENVESIVIDTRSRLHSVEEQIALLRQDVVRIDHRMDRFDEHLQRIERRLDLIEV
ncbi:hypothetical protein [Beijerinckia sp. L45]|uniref:hypothetical protein n=1 Tax=Beijerinckia sp. L45 TaxID=1641855 RepID=UPI00131D7D24|nr:hypothetical protein [Beijerinckia sp. L45]